MGLTRGMLKKFSMLELTTTTSQTNSIRKWDTMDYKASVIWLMFPKSKFNSKKRKERKE